MHNNFATRKLAVLALLIFLFTGCDTVDPASETDEAPAVIPQEAFALNLGVMEQEAPASKNGAAYANWLNATIRAGVAIHITHAILEVPFELTKAVQHVPPVYNENAYIWSTETFIDEQRHSIALKAQNSDEFINWQMKVSGVDEESGLAFEDFLLYSARTYKDVNEGSFQVYFPVESGSQQVMDGTYNVVDEEEHTLTFSIPDGVEDIGGSSAVFDHLEDQITLDLTGPLGGRHLIEWNETTGAGSLTADDYNNGEKACWDEELKNTPCDVAS